MNKRGKSILENLLGYDDDKIDLDDLENFN